MAGRLRSPAQRLAYSTGKTQFARPAVASGPLPSQSSAPWRGWYKTARWKHLRAKVLLRDGYTCQWPGCGRVLGGKSPDDDSPVVDHIRAHRGDERLFWCETNLQTLCKSPCHDRHKQALEQESRNQVGVWD
jgi:5-methylcytosine-specific restriction endonuclease McrA